MRKKNNFVVRYALCVMRNTHYARRNTHHAFTLVELLISVAIVSLVGVAIYSVFANGVNAWRKGTENKSYARNIRLSSEKLGRELRNAFKFSEIAFEGTDDSIQFAGLISVQSEYDEDEEEGEEKGEQFRYELGRIAYFYDRKEDALCKEEKTFPQTVAQEEIEDGEVVIANVREIEFSYCYLDNATGSYEWKDDWDKEEQDTIPLAVKLEMTFKNKDKFSKTVFLPTGTGEQKKELGSITTQVETDAQ